MNSLSYGGIPVGLVLTPTFGHTYCDKLWHFFIFLRPTACDRNRKENNSDKSLSFWEMADPRILYLKCLKRHLFCVHWQMTFSEVNFFTQKDWRLRPVRKYLNPMFFMNENFLFFNKTNISLIWPQMIKAYMGWLGFEPWVAGWLAKTNPLSYGGTHWVHCFFLFFLLAEPSKDVFLPPHIP